jgi:GTPase SAR1 family protein
MLKERYKCHHFRILVIGRANAGKTTILKKVCGVENGTEPIIYDKNGVKLQGKLNIHHMHIMPFYLEIKLLQCVWTQQMR